MFACCDESGIDGKSRWWSFGVLWLPDEALVPRFEADIMEARQRLHCYGEFKWSSVTDQMLPAYIALLDLTFALPDLRITNMVVDSHELDPEESKKYHADRQEAYLKFMRMIIQKRLPTMVGNGHHDFTFVYDRLGVKGDHKKQFRKVLRADMEKVARTKGVDCKYAHLSQGNSAVVSLLQAVDLVIGATRAAWAEELDGANSKAKYAICERIEKWAGVPLLDHGHGWNRHYNLFWMRFDKSRTTR